MWLKTNKIKNGICSEVPVAVSVVSPDQVLVKVVHETESRLTCYLLSF